MKIELSIFSNATKSAPKIEIIKATYESFVKTFGQVSMKIYLDPHPNVRNHAEYRRNLVRQFKCEIIATESLSDGYIKSIRESDADYLFQLEHDWEFHSDLIKHSLNEIIEVMKEKGLYHFRFSKHENKIVPELMKWQTKMEEKECNGMKYCETDNLSNNPHIIDRKYYLENLMERIGLLPGSRGIEGNLTKKELIGCQYGGQNYPATIRHLQGRKSS